jgi:WD40 repeat protein
MERAMIPAEESRRCPTCQRIVIKLVGGQCPRCMVRVLRRTSSGAMREEPGTGVRPPSRWGEAPKFFGDYELLSELGRGGMGIVLRARQLSLGRFVAVKFIAAERLNSPKAVERFHAEAEATAHLDHPNIVPIYETGEVDGRQYFSMKLIEGRTLTWHIAGPKRRNGRPPDGWRSTAAFVAKVADAIHYAHQRGILHRDLKPGNILVDDSGEPHVTDFGLASYFERERNLSLSGEVLGTPAYMAPEQAMGRARPTTAADVYSLGAILYEMLTGSAPFRGETSLQILEAVVHQEPVSPRVQRPAVPRDLATIALRCLEKEPSKRYASAEAVADELRRFLNGEPILARPISLVGRLWRWRRRNAALAAALLAIIVVCLSGLTGVLWQWHRATVSARESRQKELAARANLYAADMNVVRQALADDNFRQALDLLHRHIPMPGEPDLRGFEWRFFWQQTRSEELFRLPGHQRSAICVAFSPDQPLLITGGFDREAVIWDLMSRRPIISLQHPDQVQSVAFSPDGALLATGSASLVRLWDARTHQPLRTLDAASGKVVFSPAGTHLVTTSPNGLMVWDTRQWQLAGTRSYTGLQEINADGVGFDIAVSPDGGLIAVAGDDGIRLFHLPGFAEAGVLPERMPRRCFLAFSPGGQTLAASTRGHVIKVWDLASRHEILSWPGHSDSVFSGGFSPDGSLLATCSADQTLKLWNVSTGELIRTCKGHADEVWDLAFSPDGKRLASVGKDGAVKVWDAEKEPRRDLVLRDVDPLGFSPEGHLLAIARGGTLSSYDPLSGRKLSSRNFLGLGPRRQLQSFLGNLFGDGRTAVLFDAGERQLEVWDLGRGRVLCTVESTHRHASFSAPAQLLATATANDTVSVWQLPTGLRRWILTHATPPFALSPDGRILVTGHPKDRSFRLWRLAGNSARLWAVVPGDDEHQESVAFSPDNRLLAVGTWEGTVRLLEMPSGRQTGLLVGHKRAVDALAFSPDGRTLATVSDDSSIRLWHVATQREVAQFQELGDNMEEFVLAFSPDGRVLAAERTRSDQDITRLWYAPSLAEIAAAPARQRD